MAVDDAQVVPFDDDAEKAVLGRLLLRCGEVEQVRSVLQPSDFYRPLHQAMYDAMLAKHSRGELWDVPVLHRDVVEAGTPADVADLLVMMADAPVILGSYADRVADLAARRRLIYAANEAAAAAHSTADVSALAAEFSTAMLGVANPAGAVPESLVRMDLVADRVAERSPWVVPGLFRSGWRAVIVGPEGSGKSLFTLQVGMAASAGIHPLNFQPIDPITVLVVDLENPDDEVTDRVANIRRKISLHPDGQWSQDRAWIWEEPGGIDLRSRKHRGELDAICARVKPALVCIGPVYKAYEKRSGERGHEDGVRDLQHILDDLRTRHGFALMLEHHAPFDAGQGLTSKRVMRPSDSMLWLRWPEIGIGLTPDDERPKSVLHCKRWKGDRVKASWPDQIQYGTTLPWLGYWNEAGGAHGY